MAMIKPNVVADMNNFCNETPEELFEERKEIQNKIKCKSTPLFKKATLGVKLLQTDFKITQSTIGKIN